VTRERGLSDEERPARPPTAGLDEMLPSRFDRDPHAKARRLVMSLGISPQVLITQLHKGLGMKDFHLRWVAMF
jgi:hypothetical protein